MSFNPNAPQNRSADAAIGPQKGRGLSPDAAARHNPGTRVTLTDLPGYTQPGLLDTQQFQFPAPPLDQFQRTLTYNWGDYNTIADGQFSRPSGMQLQVIQFDSLLVADEYPWLFYNSLTSRNLDHDDMARELGKILRSATPFKLSVDEVTYNADPSGTTAGVNYAFSSVLKMNATLRTFVATKKAGEPDAVYITCGFTEHRIAGADERKLGDGTSKKGGENSRTLPAKLSLASAAGKSLHDLAVTYYGSATMWTFIKDTNPWLGNIAATHDLGVHDTAALKTAARSGKTLTLLVSAGGGRA